MLSWGWGACYSSFFVSSTGVGASSCRGLLQAKQSVFVFLLEAPQCGQATFSTTLAGLRSRLQLRQ